MNPPQYKAKPIRSINALSRALGVSSGQLLQIAEDANTLYRAAKEIPKPDGTIRCTFDALPQLKKLHTRIKCNILSQVQFPDYLTGSIKGCDYKTNAAFHIDARIVICEDIEKFFPSTTTDQVFDIWHGFFEFSKPVADCLTLLTILDGALPQGARTSPYLANLTLSR